MKTEPTVLDREAARLFVPAPGMRVCVEGTWIRVANADYGFDEPGQCATDAHSSFTIDALDTDDPATVGCMLAQVEAVVGKPIDTWMSTKGPMPELPYAVESGPYVTIGRGATRGHALLAAMRGLKRAT